MPAAYAGKSAPATAAAATPVAAAIAAVAAAAIAAPLLSHGMNRFPWRAHQHARAETAPTASAASMRAAARGASAQPGHTCGDRSRSRLQCAYRPWQSGSQRP